MSTISGSVSIEENSFIGGPNNRNVKYPRSSRDDSEEVEEVEPLNPDKQNYVFGMHPISSDNVVIDPNYPPHFFPYLYPHLFPHLFPKLYPHYAKNYKESLKKKKEKETRPITVVLPDGRNILMNKKEFMAYQLALSQQGYNIQPSDIQRNKVRNDRALELDDRDDPDEDTLSKVSDTKNDSKLLKKTGQLQVPNPTRADLKASGSATSKAGKATSPPPPGSKDAATSKLNSAKPSAKNSKPPSVKPDDKAPPAGDDDDDDADNKLPPLKPVK